MNKNKGAETSFPPTSLSFCQCESHESGQTDDKVRRGYVQISQEERNTLLRLVMSDRLTIKKAAVLLDIHYSAAKSIVKIYKDTGRIDKLAK